MKEYELLKINGITYTNRKIIYQKHLLKKIMILYDDIDSFYTCIKPCLLFFRRISFAKYIVISTKNGKKYYIQISISASLSFFDAFEEQHIAFIKKMAPNAKYIKKVTTFKRIKNKMKQIDTYLRSDD